jgi:hypothetical protein
MDQKTKIKSLLLLYKELIFFSARLPNKSSISTAEAKALQLAFDFIKYSDNKKPPLFIQTLSLVFKQ